MYNNHVVNVILFLGDNHSWFYLQPANVFMQKDYTLKLIDFGCARKIPKMETGEVVDAIGVTEFTGD